MEVVGVGVVVGVVVVRVGWGGKKRFGTSKHPSSISIHTSCYAAVGSLALPLVCHATLL